MSAVEIEILDFRAMREDDLPAVMAIEKESHAFPWSEGIFKDCLHVGYFCQLAANQNRVAAYGIMSVAVGEAHIFNICVAKSLRNQGLGKKMILHLLDIAQKKRANTVFLEVRPSNSVAIALYEQFGFIETGMRKDYYPAVNGGREDALIMAKELVDSI